MPLLRERLDYQMRIDLSVMRMLVLTLSVSIISSFVFVHAQTPAAALKPEDKLAVRLKAKLPDYKGPSRFMGRKALIVFSPDGRQVAMSGTKRTITVWD